MENSPKTERKNLNLMIGAALGGLSSLAVIAILYLGEQAFALPFVPFDIFDWMTRTLPGGLIAFVIRTMVLVIGYVQDFLPIGDTSTVSKLAEQSIALFQLVAGGVFFGGLLAWFHRKENAQLSLYGQLGGLTLLAITLIIESSLETIQLDAISSLWLAVIFIGWGWLLAYLVKSAIPAKNEEEDQALSRRQFLKVSGAGISAVALGAWGLTALFGEDAIEELAVVESDVFSGGDPFGAMGTSGPAASPSPAELAARPAPVTGTRPELTPTKDYYRIDINTRPSQVDIESWRLIVSGKISAPTEMTIDDIRALPSQTQILTMQCISNNVGGDLTSSTRWTGVKFKDLMDSLGMDPSAAGALIKGVDGFYEYVVMEDILDDRTLLVYDMNGAPLPQKHGFPLRVYIPNRYGMKQPKWIESIEITENWVEGYWVERGWSKEAFTHTVSVVDAVVVDPDGGENGIARAGGIAWASARGISKVEVKIDSGSWQEAELISPPLSPLTWVLWRIAWDYTPGRYQISVRAYDGQGQLQRSEKRSPRPDGATGLHTISVNI